MIEWVFLDFDNTLMRTEDMALPSLIERFNALYSQNLTLSEFKTHFHGQAREHLCDSLGKHFGIRVEFKDLYHNREAYIKEVMDRVKVEMAPNLLESLLPLKFKGIKFALVTNNPIDRAKSAMENASNGRGSELLSLFEPGALFEASDIQKPNPHVYLKALSQVGADPSRTIAVEDSLTGAKASLGAGLKTFGYTYYGEFGLGKKLHQIGVNKNFSDWADFPNLL